MSQYFFVTLVTTTKHFDMKTIWCWVIIDITWPKKQRHGTTDRPYDQRNIFITPLVIYAMNMQRYLEDYIPRNMHMVYVVLGLAGFWYCEILFMSFGYFTSKGAIVKLGRQPWRISVHV